MSRRILPILLVFVMVVLACNAPGTPVPLPPTPDQGSAKTQMALDVKATVLAQKEATLAAGGNVQAPTATDKPIPPTDQPTYTPYPTYTQPPEATATEKPSDTPEAAPTQDLQARIKSANILVFEDIRGYFDLLPRVQQAMRGMSFSGGQIVEVGDAVGDFMRELNSPTKWDLIIVAAEARSGVRGEFWDMISKQADKNVALAIEVWYVDEVYYDKLDSLMYKCGIQFQKDWRRPATYNLLDYSIYWLQPDHPLFTAKNVVGPLVTPTPYWMGDAGDLIKLAPASTAQLLAGTQPSVISSYGTLASCLDGRMVFQTFSTHDYRQSETVALWQNYIIYTLTNHFKVTP
jgi:hypothetical protein